MNEKDLKPCPFCGGKVSAFHTEHLSMRKRRFDFNCTRCDAYISLTVSSNYVSAEATEMEAVEAFNRRYGGN